MRRLTARECVFSAMLAIFLLPAFGQDTASDAPWWYDVPSAPLKFDIPLKDPAYEETQLISIRSAGGIVKAYSLGCVRLEDGAVLNTETIRTWPMNQRPEDQIFPRHILRITAVPCSRKSERLAVVRVEYADGGIWQLSTAPASNGK